MQHKNNSLAQIFKMDKQELKTICLTKIREQQVELQMLIDEVQYASNNETKSTAGDKHDTARAQAQIEVERLNKQLSVLNAMHNELYRLPIHETNKIQLGSYVQTTQGNFYVAVALGRITFDTETFFVISSVSPLYNHLKGKCAGDQFELSQGNAGVIHNVT